MPKKLGPPQPCECGCGAMARRRYLSGHNRPVRHRKSPVDYLIEDRGYATPCWVWQQGKSKQGYGMVALGGKRFLMHRVMYEQSFGPVPEGLELDHLCRIRHCINPAHLEAVTHAVNTQRGARAKLNEDLVRQAKGRNRAGESHVSIARSFGVDPSIICDLVNGRIWKGVV